MIEIPLYKFVSSMSYKELTLCFSSFLGLLSGAYIVIIAPLIFKFFIIPKIEDRYGKKLVFDSPAYIRSRYWGMPPLEMSTYIVFLYFGWTKLFEKNKYIALQKINYEIKTARKLEIRAAFVTFFLLLSLFPCGAIVLIFDNHHSNNEKVVSVKKPELNIRDKF